MASNNTSAISDELDALEAVLAEDFKHLDVAKDNDKFSHAFEAHIFPQEDLSECHCSVHLKIEIPINYPTTQPFITILSCSGLNAAHQQELLAFIAAQLYSECRNEEMLYPIIDYTQQFLFKHNYLNAESDAAKTVKVISTEDNSEAITADKDENTGVDDEWDDNSDGADEWNDVELTTDDTMAYKSGRQMGFLRSEDDLKTDRDVSSALANAKHFDRTHKKVLTMDDVIDLSNTNSTAMAMSDCFEVSKCENGLFAECLQWQNDSKALEITVGIHLPTYLGSDILCSVLGFDKDEFLSIRLKFSNNYIGNSQCPEIMAVGRCKPKKKPRHSKQKKRGTKSGESERKSDTNDDSKEASKEIDLKTKIEPFMGSQSIHNRVSQKFLPRYWPPSAAEQCRLDYRPYLNEIHRLMVVTNYDFITCRDTLIQSKNFEKALLRLTQNQSQPIVGGVKKADLSGILSLCQQLINWGQSEDTLQQTKHKSDPKPKSDSKSSKKVKPTSAAAVKAVTDTKSGDSNPNPNPEGISQPSLQSNIDLAVDSSAISDEKSDEIDDIRSTHLSLSPTQQCAVEKLLHDSSHCFSHNTLFQILFFTLHSALTVNQRCLVCDIAFPIADNAAQMIKPTVCNNQMCLFAHNTLEVGLDLGSFIAHQPELMDLLITFCYVATKKNCIKSYYPTLVRGMPPATKKSFMTKKGRLAPEKLEKVLDKLPSMSTIVSWSKRGTAVLKRNLTAKSPLMFPLLTWLVTSNRAHLRLIESKRERFRGVPSGFQFEFMTASPEREYRFQQLVNKAELSRGIGNGSLWAWHGSPMGNWHCILRTGLKNMSHSKDMKNGAAYGNGIYLAADSGTSYWYSEPSRSDTWPLSMFNRDDYYGRSLNSQSGHGLYCLALCQIVNHPKLQNFDHFYVVPTQSWVITRYLFVFNTLDTNQGWRGKGRYFDIAAQTLIDNHRKRLNPQSHKS